MNFGPGSGSKDVHEARARMLSVAGALVTALIAGTIGYHVVEGWSFFDSLYMTVITLSTVGYGEVHDLSDSGRIFTIFLILGGVMIVTYSFSTITAVLVEGRLSQALQRRRMEKDIAKLTGHYIICGSGHAGLVILDELRKTKRPFVLVEQDPKVVEKLIGEGCYVIEGDATEDSVLIAAGIERAAGVFAVLSTDQDNAFVALTAKGLNPKIRVVAAQRELSVRDKLIRSGADNVVNAQFIGGLRMASEMIRPATTGFLDSMLRDRGSVFRFGEVAIPAASPFVGKPVGSIKGSEGNAPLLVALLDPESGKYEINPAAPRLLRAGERLVLLGDADQLEAMRERIERA